MILGLSALSLIIWLYLTFAHHGFWRRREFLPEARTISAQSWPNIISLTPARNEAELISRSFSSILQQKYSGSLESVLIDDASQDGTAVLARQTADEAGRGAQAHIIQAPPLQKGWSGKLWALQAGLDQISDMNRPSDYYWLSDADIHHEADVLSRLVSWAQKEDLGLVSLMVSLNCNSFWENRIIPAFIYYFQMLYPFASINNPDHKQGGAAGGCILIRGDALEEIGGFHAIKDKLIDDCELGKAVKAKGYKIWLGHGINSQSLRPSTGLGSLWKMVTRTAFVQLNYSYIYLFLAILGMFILYGVPVFAFIFGLLQASPLLAVLGGLAWGLMALTFWPTLKAYKRPWPESLLMPFTAHFFMAMTLQAGWLHFRGKHSGWHGRVYTD